VFPVFLFIAGLSIPLAIRGRLVKGNSQRQLWWHVLARSVGLLVLGIALANAQAGDAKRMGITANAWGLLVLLGAILCFSVNTGRVVKLAGLTLLVAMFAIFRTTTGWLDFSYWEILGLIGWTYLVVCCLYIPTLRWRWAAAVWLAALIILNALSSAKWLVFPEALPMHVWPVNNGAFATLMMAGVVTAQIFFSEVPATFRQKAGRGAAFALILLAGGWLLSPLGISKIRATPTWSLWSAGASVLLFLALYWICDVKRWTAWGGFVKAAGSNTLLTYLLPDLIYFAVSWRWLPPIFKTSWLGTLQAFVFTAFILLLSTLLTKWKVRVQL
jgi:heparan-alpha-glucosaminide N-acetyltransferase